MNQKRKQQSADPRMKFFAGAAILLIIVGAIFIFSGANEERNDKSGTPQLKISEESFDFGDISMSDGLAKRSVELKNEGDGILKFSDLSTSCMCTSVTLIVNEKRSPKFGMKGHGVAPRGWSQKLQPGESATLEIVFDPLAHGPSATGPITRDVTIISNSNGEKETRDRIIFRGNVTK